MAVNLKGNAAPPAAAPVTEAGAEDAVIPSAPKGKLCDDVPAPQKGGGELAKVLSQLNKEKPGTIIMGHLVPPVGRIPTGVFEFDYATGGGFPEGRLSIVYGPESSGKTNICFKGIATVQARPGPCNKVVFVNLEGTYDSEWAKAMGVDTERLIVINPAYGEEAVDMIDAIIYADDVALVVVDSIAVLVAAKEIEKTTEIADVGSSSLLTKRLCNKLAIALGNERKRGHMPAVIFVNQTRFKAGVVMGDPETMPGGKTMMFMASLIVRLYGKNEIDAAIHPKKPAWKNTNAVIKKAKMGINQIGFEYKMAMMTMDPLQIGDTSSWNTVKSHLQAGNLLVQAKNGWDYGGENYPKLSAMQDRYYVELDFRLEAQAHIFKAAGPGGIVEIAGNLK